MEPSPHTGPMPLRELAELMATRRSIRRYALETIAPEVVDDLLRCAADAPSAHNRQPWRFAILRDAAVKTRLADAMGTRLRQDRLADGTAADVVEADVRRSFQRITGAPVVLAVATTTIDMDVYPDGSRREAEYLMAVQSTAMAVQNLLLAAHAAGIAGCWMCAPLFCPDAVRDALGLPADWQPQALVTLGVAGSEGKAYRRRPLAEIVHRVDSA